MARKHIYSYDVSDLEGLALQIIACAANDLHCGDKTWRESAVRFFESDWYQTLCDFLDIAPAIRDRPLEEMKKCQEKV